ncbi:MAG: hypothetical protein ABIO80_04695 [Sphingomicrobium sp.]
MAYQSKVLIAAIAGLTLAGCNKKQPANDQNIFVDNGTIANAEIETLPADESSGTPADELANGSDDPDVNDLNDAANAD